MTTLNDSIKLNNYDVEDIFDVVWKLENSFGLNFENDAFAHVKTFGDLCDVITNHFKMEDSDTCTSQQAFYKVRNAIASAQNIAVNSITTDTQLHDIFPRKHRKTMVKELQDELQIPLNILDIKSWLANTIIIGIIVSLLTFLFNWQLAIIGFLFFISANVIAHKYFANELKISTIRQLTEMLTKENYTNVRRVKNTVNKKEITKIIVDTFSNDLDIEKVHLTRNDTFDW